VWTGWYSKGMSSVLGTKWRAAHLLITCVKITAYNYPAAGARLLTSEPWSFNRR
jgi:hypothetical protein